MLYLLQGLAVLLFHLQLFLIKNRLYHLLLQVGLLVHPRFEIVDQAFLVPHHYLILLNLTFKLFYFSGLHFLRLPVVFDLILEERAFLFEQGVVVLELLHFEVMLKGISLHLRPHLVHFPGVLALNQVNFLDELQLHLL